VKVVQTWQDSQLAAWMVVVKTYAAIGVVPCFRMDGSGVESSPGVGNLYGVFYSEEIFSCLTKLPGRVWQGARAGLMTKSSDLKVACRNTVIVTVLECLCL
jgi:hypothetical protein